MIQVSNEFKKAIKKPERKIKGYVEVLYDLPSVAITPTTNITSSYTNLSEIINGKRVSNNYGTLDYLPLDGSVLTVGESDNENSGFISDGIVSDYIQTPRDSVEVVLNFNETTIKGFTMYFKDNGIKDFIYTLSDGTQENVVYEEAKNVVQVMFGSPKTITSITLWLNEFEYEYKKIRIEEIDLGITQVYKDQDLIEFTVDEEVNKLVEEVPINETNITLNNMSNLFNPLNPSGIVPYLSENTLIKPYIGVLTENLGVEYVKMGEFYFDSYTNNSDATTTLVGKNLMKQLEQETLKDDNEYNLFQVVLNENEFDNYMSNYNYDYEKNWTRNLGPVLWNENSLLKFLKDMAFWQENLFYIDRNNVITNKQIDYNIKDTLSKTELINDAEFKYIEKINTFKLIKNTRTSDGTSTSRQIVKETVKLDKSSQVFLITSNSPDMMSATVSQSGGTSATIISVGFYMAFVKVTGTEGNTVELTFTSANNGNTSKTEIVSTNKKDETEKSISFDSGIYYVATQSIVDSFNILDKIPSYEMRFDYNGDPSLEAGDYINVETPYGYKQLFIQKNRFKFDGGLEGSIEGVE